MSRRKYHFEVTKRRFELSATITAKEEKIWKKIRKDIVARFRVFLPLLFYSTWPVFLICTCNISIVMISHPFFMMRTMTQILMFIYTYSTLGNRQTHIFITFLSCTYKHVYTPFWRHRFLFNLAHFSCSLNVMFHRLLN